MKKLLIAFMMTFVIFSCGSSSANKQIVINLIEEGSTMDTTLMTSQVAGTISSFLNEGLTKVNPETKVVEPALAEKWEVSEDGLEWTIHLKDGLKWSDGSDLTANDFKYAWLRALDPNVASEYAYMLFPIKNGENFNSGKVSSDEVGIEVVDAKTLKVTLENPTPYFDTLLGFATYYPVNQKFVEEKGDNYALEADTLISSGAYVVKSWEHNSSMILEKNPNYYNKDKIDIDTVVIKFIKDSASALNAFKNDEVDLLEITQEQYPEFKDNKNVDLVDTAQVWYLSFNTTNDVLKNAKVRKALLQAIDKETIVSSLFNNINKPVYNFVPSGVGVNGTDGKDFTEQVGTLGAKFNPDEAKQLLAEGLKELGLQSMPKISIIVNDGGLNKKIAETLQENFRVNLGIEVDVELIAFKERLQRMHNANYDIALAGWSADYLDPMTYLDLFVSNSGNNHGKYSNPQYDALIKEAKTTNDPNKRFEAFKKAEEIIAKDVPIAPLFQKKNVFLTNKDKVDGIKFPTFGTQYDISNAKIK